MSLNNIPTGRPYQPQQQQPTNFMPVNFEGNLIGNAAQNINEIGASIGTLAGATLGYDPEARKAMFNQFSSWFQNPVNYVNDVLEPYNVSVDDFGKRPLGEIAGNVLAGAWKRPVTAFLDVAGLTGALGIKLPKNLKNKIPVIRDQDVRVKLAEEVARDNIKLANEGAEFAKQVQDITKKYKKRDIADAMNIIENVGIRNTPEYYRPVINDLVRANATYKSFVGRAGAKIYDDYDFAAKEYVAKRTKVPFSELDNKNFERTKTYKDTLAYVKENNIQPLFHLKPQVYLGMHTGDKKITTGLFQRAYGTIDYNTNVKNLAKNAEEFIDKVIRTKTLDSAESLNKKIYDYNTLNKTDVKPLADTDRFFSNKTLNEINRELKKTMLAGGIYLGANILSTTLSILNNWDLNAARYTIKNRPKFRLVDLNEAQTPGLRFISKVNNMFYRPIASVDRYIENFGRAYQTGLPEGMQKYSQSIVPSAVVPTNVLEQAVKTFIPFGSYPVAAYHELAANVAGRPYRTLAYNQAAKFGSQINQEAQENTPGLREVDPTKIVRYDPREQKLFQRSTVVTPIQAANMFILGQQGDAIQIPIVNFLNKLISGKGDPNVFTVNGRNYRIENGEIQTENGSYSLLPALKYAARNMLTPVQFYNTVITPLLTDKYIKDESLLFNKAVSDTQYANMSSDARKKVVTKSREKLGKRLLGTYEYNYFKPYVSSRNRRNLLRQYRTRQELRRLKQFD